MNAMTILFSPKPFVGLDAVNQRNALARPIHFSVTRLGIARPRAWNVMNYHQLGVIGWRTK